MEVFLCLNELVSDFFSAEKGVQGLKFRTDNGLVTFWGELGESNENITTLRNQSLPVVVERLDPEICVPSLWYKNENGLTWSIPK